jgi:hypothetical protein
MREHLVAKLRPDRFTAMSGKMATIVGYILGRRTDRRRSQSDRGSSRHDGKIASGLWRRSYSRSPRPFWPIPGGRARKVSQRSLNGATFT